MNYEILSMDKNIPLSVVIRKASELVDNKEYKAANALYSIIQELYPEHPDCLHGMGVMALIAGQYNISIQLIHRALKALDLLPNPQQYHVTRGLMLAHLGKSEENLGLMAQALYYWLESLDANNNQEIDKWLKNGFIEAKKISERRIAQINEDLGAREKEFRQSLYKNNNNKKVKNQASNKANGAFARFCKLKDEIQRLIGIPSISAAKEAEILCKELLLLLPDYPDALHWMGIAKHYQKKSEDAIEWIVKALEQIPEHPYYHNTLGVIRRNVGYIDSAIESFNYALKYKPDYAESAMNLGNVLRDEGMIAQAKIWYKWAIYAKDDYAEVWNNLGVLHKNIKNYKLAEECFNKTLSLNPKYAKAYLNLGVIAEEQKDRKKSIAMYTKTLECRPDTHEVRLSLIHQKMYFCNWSNLDQEIEYVRKLIEEDYPGEFLPFNFMSLEGVTGQEQRKCTEIFAHSRYSSFRRQSAEMGFAFEKSDKKKIRLGFLSTDYREHAVAISIVEMIELFDRNNFDVFAYSYGVHEITPTRKRLMQAFDMLHDIEEMNHPEAARKIYSDGVDILIDLTGYTSGCRAEILALHPAPIQVSYLGYSGTLGVDYVEYLLGDAVVTPPEHQQYYTENLAILPDCYFPTDRKREIGEKISRATESLPDDAFVFCSFNQPYKITPSIWKVWCELLLEVDRSVLWLHSFDTAARESLLSSAKLYGVDEGRIIFATVKKELKDHLSRLKLANLALDSIPYNGHTTTNDALWVGLPVVTCIGDAFHSRVAASMLTSVGLSNLIANNLIEYKAKALELAQHPEILSEIRNSLKESRNTCPLFNIPKLTKNIEAAFKQMYAIWSAGERPKQFMVGQS